MTNHDEGREVWENIRSLLPNEREQQLAYLLFHCGLGPREIVRLRPQEWSDVCEIYRLRRNIFEQLLSNYETPLPTQPQQNLTTWFRHIDRSA